MIGSWTRSKEERITKGLLTNETYFLKASVCSSTTENAGMGVNGQSLLNHFRSREQFAADSSTTSQSTCDEHESNGAGDGECLVTQNLCNVLGVK